MSATETTYSAEFQSGYRATLTVSLKGFRCEWTPDLPKNMKGADRDALLESYRAWRHECLTDFARTNGLTLRTIRIDGIDAIAFCRPEDAT